MTNPTATTADMERNMDLLRRTIEEGFGKDDVSVIDQVVAPQFVQHQDGVPPTREGLKAVITDLHRIYPDLAFTVEDMTTDGDKVRGRFRARGTQLGEMMGLPATGKTMEVTVIDIVRVADRKVVEHWGFPTDSPNWNSSVCG